MVDTISDIFEGVVLLCFDVVLFAILSAYYSDTAFSVLLQDASDDFTYDANFFDVVASTDFAAYVCVAASSDVTGSTKIPDFSIL